MFPSGKTSGTTSLKQLRSLFLTDQQIKLSSLILPTLKIFLRDNFTTIKLAKKGSTHRLVLFSIQPKTSKYFIWHLSVTLIYQSNQDFLLILSVKNWLMILLSMTYLLTQAVLSFLLPITKTSVHTFLCFNLYSCTYLSLSYRSPLLMCKSIQQGHRSSTLSPYLTQKRLSL